MLLKHLFFIFFNLIIIATRASQSNSTLSHEAKEWLFPGYKTYEEEKKNSLEEAIEECVKPNTIFITLRNRCKDDPSNPISHLAKATHWFDYLKKDIDDMSDYFDVFAIDELMNDKDILFNSKEEKDIFYFTLSHFLSNRCTFSCPDLYPISLQTFNRFIYHKQIEFNLSTLAKISSITFVNNESYKTDNLKALFKPTMYYPVFKGSNIAYVIQHSYKKICDTMLNIQTITTCFHVLKKEETNKISRLLMPKPLIKKIIESNLDCSRDNFVKESNRFINYCNLIENIMPKLLQEYNESHWCTSGKAQPIETIYFKKMYAELKKN